MMLCKPSLKSCVCTLVLAVGSALSMPTLAAPHIVLVQNSGWMEPFYVDPKSQFADLVDALVQTLGSTSQDITLATFSQATQGVSSPAPLKRGSAKDLQGLAKTIKIQTKGGNPNAWADTDFKEAISAAVAALPATTPQTRPAKQSDKKDDDHRKGKESEKHNGKDKAHHGEHGSDDDTARQGQSDNNDGKEGIIWLVTNNKNSPSNDLDTIKRNKEYYAFLHNTPGFSRILAWPLKMPVQGKKYSANGLMIYGLAYGRQSGEQLQQFANTGIRNLLTEPAARLKPQNAEVVVFKPTGVENNPNISAALGADGKTIVLNFDAGSYVQTAKLQGQFVNAFNLYDIAQAKLSANYGGYPLAVQPETLERLEAGAASKTHALAISIPPLKDLWSMDVLMQPGQSVTGLLEIKLDQTLVPSKLYEQKFKDVFPNDPLPELFKPSQASAQSSTHLPLKLNIHYPAWPVVVLMLLIALLVAGGLFLLWLSKQERRYTVMVDGISRNILLPAFKTVAIKSDTGDVIAKITRGFGKPKLLDVSADHQIRLK